MGTLISIDEKFLKTELLLAKWLVKYANKNPVRQHATARVLQVLGPALPDCGKQTEYAPVSWRVTLRGNPGTASAPENSLSVFYVFAG